MMFYFFWISLALDTDFYEKERDTNESSLSPLE